MAGMLPIDIYKGCKSKVTEIQQILDLHQNTKENYQEIRIKFEQINALLEEDRPNEFKDAAQKLVRWLRRASDYGYLNAPPTHQYLSASDAFKKGIDVLNLLLQRDLRKQKLAGGESQVYYGFIDLVRQIPPPPNVEAPAGSNQQKAS